MKRQGKRFFAALLTCLLFVGMLPAHAVTCGGELLPEEANGYIFTLRADAPVLFQMDQAEGVEPISMDHGVYWAATLEEIEAFAPAEYLECVTPDYAMDSHAAPNDPDYVNNKAWSLPMLHMDYAWENNITGSGVRVGIVDSGVLRTHEDLTNSNVVPGTYYPAGYNTGSEPGTEEPDSPTKPTNAHGTFVAGMIAATANNNKGMAGVSPGVELVPLVAFAGGTTYLSAVCKAIYGGVDDYKCDVLNMSLGIYKDKKLSNGEYPNITPLDKAIAYAQSKGVILVASVGNDSGTMLSYPAAYEGVIGVGAVDNMKKKASFSQYNKSVFVMAPGANVYSLSHAGDTAYGTGNGTSYAAPQVTAAVALAMEMDPYLTSDRVMELLASTAKDLGDVGRDDYYGNGLMDVSAFLQAVEAPQMTTASADGGVELSVRWCHRRAESEITVLAAAYDAAGRMVDVEVQPVTVGSDGVLAAEGLYLDTTADAVEARLFVWDGATGVPLLDPYCVTLEK